jgi:hypothetical protein
MPRRRRDPATVEDPTTLHHLPVERWVGTLRVALVERAGERRLDVRRYIQGVPCAGLSVSAELLPGLVATLRELEAASALVESLSTSAPDAE